MTRIRISAEELKRATLKQRIAYDLYLPGESRQRDLDARIGAKSGKALAMRLYRLRKRLGVTLPGPRGSRSKRSRKRIVRFEQLSIFEGY